MSATASKLGAGRISRQDLAGSLGESLGREKADEVVVSAARKLGLGLVDYDHAEAMEILEVLAAEPGLVGVVARFTKVRMILQR